MSDQGDITNAAAVAHAIGEAQRACGAIITLGSQSFYDLVSTLDDPFVVYAETGFFSKTYRYVTSWRGLTFYAQSKTVLPLQGKATVVMAKMITIPSI